MEQDWWKRFKFPPVVKCPRRNCNRRMVRVGRGTILSFGLMEAHYMCRRHGLSWFQDDTEGVRAVFPIGKRGKFLIGREVPR
jgi:hypothetical protein